MDVFVDVEVLDIVDACRSIMCRAGEASRGEQGEGRDETKGKPNRRAI